MASFILTYDLGATLGTHGQLAAFVKANRHVTQWAQPFLGCYLLKSDAGLTVLQSSFSEFFGGQTLHMLALINSDQTSGLLPPAIWTWLNQPERSALAAVLAQYSGIPPASGQ
jgi:hypothetical protein